jgi:diguanylate cyclase (GGDEF)-like protein
VAADAPTATAVPRTAAGLDVALEELEVRWADHAGPLQADVARRRAALDGAPGADAARDRQRLALVAAQSASMSVPLPDAARVAREVLQSATEAEDAYVQGRAHRVLSMVLAMAGDPALALEHALHGIELAGADADDGIRADHLLALADGLGVSRAFAESITRYREAEALAVRAGVRSLQLVVLNNLAFTAFEAGDVALALETVERLVAVAAADGRESESFYFDTIVRVYLLADRLDDAVATLQRLQTSSADLERELGAIWLLTLAEVRRRQGDLPAAEAALDRFDAVCADGELLRGLAVEALRERSELLAAAGRFEEALAAFKAYHERDGELRAQEREARSQVMHAVFETGEARLESARYRELSLRDPLTGLHNRRFVEDWLEARVEAAAADGAGGALTVAFLDLDHFKRINDRCSHDAGDQVLRRVAGLIQAAFADLPDGLTARMGGEEFLVACAGAAHAEALDRLEGLRRRVACEPWGAATGGLPVTISIGAAGFPADGRGRRELLAAADRRLYRAKSRGRNRLEAGGRA